MRRSELADEYFNRSLSVVAGTPREHTRVRYAVFCRQSGVLAGVDAVLRLVRARCGPDVRVCGKSDGQAFAPLEVVLTLEGPFGQLVTLETEYLGYLAWSAAAANMAAIVEAAGDIPVIDMAARHFPPELSPGIGVAAAVGGATGTSTAAGHAEAHVRFGIGAEQVQVAGRPPRDFKLYGTIPHALNAVFEGDSVESAVAYHDRYPDVPLTILVDFEGTERDVISAAVRRFGSALQGVRLDIAGSRVHQGGHEKANRALEMRILSAVSERAAAQAALDRYGFGPGVTIESVYNARDLLNSLGARQTQIVVSGGFTPEKARAFMACRAPMDAIGTGSWVQFAPFTSDIVKVHDGTSWVTRCKAGRADEFHEPEGLPLLLETC